jgi:hypothetical protein
LKEGAGQLLNLVNQKGQHHASRKAKLTDKFCCPCP